MTYPKMLQPITRDLIRELRARHMGVEATLLLQAHYKDIKNAGKNAVNSLYRRDRKIKRFFNICSQDDCMNKAEKGKAYCKKHIEIRKKWERKYKELKCVIQ